MSLNIALGARNGAKNSREENDFYATHPMSTRIFLDALERDGIKLSNQIWEMACGEGHMSEVFKEYGHEVYSSDLIDRNYGDVKDFLECNTPVDADLFTNPPFKDSLKFAYKGNELLTEGHLFGLFLKLQFLEGKARRQLFEQYPPKYIYVYSNRQLCSKNADFENYHAKTLSFGWFLWEKNFKGDPIVRWI